MSNTARAPGGELLILVPTLNEAANVGTAMDRILGELPEAHVLVIDDCSTDGTIELAQARVGTDPRVHLMVRRERQPGLGDSIRDAYRYALDHDYRNVCIVDCDLQTNPADVRRMQADRGESAIVVGSRYAQGVQASASYPWLDKHLSTLANFGVRVLFGMRVRDVTTDFFLLDTRVLAAVPPEGLRCRGYALFSEIKVRAQRAGFHLHEIGAPSSLRAKGESKRTLKQVRVFAREILTLWWELAQRSAPL